MVYYDHNRVVAGGGRKIGDEVDRELFKGEGGRGGDGHKWRDGQMGVDFILLTKGTPIDKVFHEGRETRPPKVTFKDSLGAEDTQVTCGGGRMDGVEERGAGQWGNIHLSFKVKVSIVISPIRHRRVREQG